MGLTCSHTTPHWPRRRRSGSPCCIRSSAGPVPNTTPEKNPHRSHQNLTFIRCTRMAACCQHLRTPSPGSTEYSTSSAHWTRIRNQHPSVLRGCGYSPAPQLPTSLPPPIGGHTTPQYPSICHRHWYRGSTMPLLQAATPGMNG